ncbi:MAG: hypothetical protein ABIS91_10460 [Nocardioides sp.]
MRVQSRRTDAFPTTWEIPAGVALIWVVGAFLALPAGQGLAYAATGHGFVWPGDQLGSSLLGLLTGEPGRGLSKNIAAVVPSTILVYICAVIVELALATTAATALVWWWRTVGPYAQFGMAARHEVVAVLGRSSLHKRSLTIRPDLVGGRR